MKKLHTLPLAAALLLAPPALLASNKLASAKAELRSIHSMKNNMPL